MYMYVCCLSVSLALCISLLLRFVLFCVLFGANDSILGANFIYTKLESFVVQSEIIAVQNIVRVGGYISRIPLRTKSHQAVVFAG